MIILASESALGTVKKAELSAAADEVTTTHAAHHTLSHDTLLAGAAAREGEDGIRVAWFFFRARVLRWSLLSGEVMSEVRRL